MRRSKKILTLLKAQWILNGIAICIWAFQFYFIGSPSEALLFNHPDSPGYVALGKWLFGGSFTPFINSRTFLFPLWFTCIDIVFGVKGFFVIQSLIWIGTVNLLFVGLMRKKLSSTMSLITSIIFCLNITILSMTYEMLTETLVVFICCLYLYSVACAESIEQLRERKGVLLFLSSLLMLLKPIFEPLFFISLVAFIYFFFNEMNVKQRMKKLLWPIISMLMVGWQFFIMIHYTGVFALSEIGDETFRRYSLSQTLSSVQQIDIISARNLVVHWSLSQIIQFVVAHFGELASNYFQNLHTNISTFPNEASAIGSPCFELNFMIWWNRFHWASQILLPLLLIFSLKKIRRQPLVAWQIIILALAMYNVVLVSAISFGQGDRLVLPAIPFAIGLYGILLKVYFPRVAGSN